MPSVGSDEQPAVRGPDLLARRRVYAREWRRANRDRINTRTRARRANDPAWQAKQAEADRLRKAKVDPVVARERARVRNLRHAFGITVDEYDTLLAAQGGVCAICRRPEVAVRGGRVKALAVDHCHESGRIRGLLCQSCNTMLGKGRDSLDLLWAAIAYLTLRGESDGN